MSDNKNKAQLLGFGFDNSDGHVRQTRGDNFKLYGGSEETHQQMQESCIKMNEKLNQKGKTLQDVEKQELKDMAADCGMNLVIIDNNSADN